MRSMGGLVAVATMTLVSVAAMMLVCLVFLSMFWRR